MSFAFTVKCSNHKKHRVVIDLAQQKIHLPAHTPEMVQRYRALRDLGGEPPNCCSVLFDLENGIRHGQLIIPGQCESQALRLFKLALGDWLSRGLFYYPNWPIIIIPGNQPPKLEGRYPAKEGTAVRHPNTYRYIVGEAWLVSNSMLDLPRPHERIEIDPDPEWETATLTEGHHDKTT